MPTILDVKFYKLVTTTLFDRVLFEIYSTVKIQIKNMYSNIFTFDMSVFVAYITSNAK